MTDRTKTGLEVLQAAFLMGILGNVLLRETPWGLNAFLFVTAFVAALGAVAVRRRPELVTGQNIALCAAMVFFSAMFLWRDSIELRTIDTFAIITLMGVLILSSLNVTAKIGGMFHYGVGIVWAGINSAFAPAMLLSTDVKWASLPKLGWSRHLIAGVRGLLIALPLILIFGSLFAAADAAYEGMIERVFNIAPETLFSHLVLTAVFFWLTAGYYRGVLLGGAFVEPVVPVTDECESPHASRAETSKLTIFEQARAEEPETAGLPNNASILDHINTSDPPDGTRTPSPASEPDGAPTPSFASDAKATPDQEKKPWQWQDLDNSLVPQAFTLGVVETSVVLGLMNLLFLSFVVVQVPYLFGGMDLVQNTPDFKLAEYARRGFGELVTVTALVLPILLVSHWLLRKENPVNEKVYRILAGIQIVLLFVIMASAMQRLFLLTGNLGYGLTTVRFYPMVVMIWFAIVFVWFGLTVLRGARQYFAWGALWSAVFVLAGIHVLNPDEFIAKTNIRLMNEGRVYDSDYNSQLSNDAAPVLVESLSSMSQVDQCVTKYELRDRLEAMRTKSDLRSFNFSRSAALKYLESIEPQLDTTGCQERSYRFFD
ncbi:MAG: DUF4173 domain-containing protein [Pyrinomonadaceae bacterium]